jgi:haloacetate dehalogenase
MLGRNLLSWRMFDGFMTTRIRTGGTEIHLRHAGNGPPVLLLHGFPQTHVCWHEVAPALAADFTVVLPDLRGYGDSGKPRAAPIGSDGHALYSKRAMARDQFEVMAQLGFDRFAVVGHDRGGRVGHRMALDHPDAVERLAVLDIVPTRRVFKATDQALATAYYHWFFLIQPYDMPERLIGAEAAFFLRHTFESWSAVSDAITPAAFAEYRRCFDAAGIHASCEDYRAAAGIDLVHDEADLDRRIGCPVLALWGSRGIMHRTFDVLATWRERAAEVSGQALDCAHFLPEEAPEATVAALRRFLGS